MVSNNSSPTSELEKWFSSARISTYSHHRDPEALYLWNTHITKAFLEDIQHVEVLLRNCINTAVAPRYGDSWFTHPAIPFDQPAKNSIRKAVRRASTSRDPAPPAGRIIAELSFDFWAYLFTNTYASTLWPLIRKALIGTPIPAAGDGKPGVLVPTLKDVKNEVDVVYKLRNRCAHHEPIIKQNQQAENDRLDRAQHAIKLLANWLDPAAAQWITTNSRIPELRSSRP